MVEGAENEYGDYVIVKAIGEGTFGNAYIVKHKADPNNVIISNIWGEYIYMLPK